jgi:hypothetical protein
MSEQIEIQGGATAFEAAVIAVVLDHLEGARDKPSTAGNDLSPWVKASRNQEGPPPTSIVRPR